MPFSHAPAVEPIHTPAEYGITEVGPDHAPVDSIADRFANERTWWIASVRPDGRAHSVPIWGIRCEGQLIFGSDPKSRKTRNMIENPFVVVHLESGDNVAILEANVVRLGVADIPAAVSTDYQAKYDVEMDTSDPAAHWYRLDPVTLLSWDESRFVETAARWRFER